jgi:eukaryotic-like serine/threonine-protein kinase
MSLQPGTRLGPYEVLSLIGAGGMGEVYRARDTRLGREVAIKVLPAGRVADADRRRRFVQEAQAASALNHPHIITIYEIESADGNDFIVMEYVRGKSLDALIPRQGMRLNEALRIAIAVADALAMAHARGIVHRDLKPANVVVGTDGTVKVLDFGLAKLIGDTDTAGEDSPTLTSHALVSAPGTIVGTAAYMAPEQATGGTVDARTDIFSFGAMLYEIVTGSRAFPGASTAETLSAVIRAQPKPPSAVVAAIQGDLEKVILRCLRKDPQRRYQHIADVKVALEDVREDSESGVTAPAAGARTHRRGAIAALVAAALVIVGATAWLLLPFHRRTQAPAAMRPVALTSLTGSEFHPTFSPDGEQVAFSWNGAKQDNWDVYVTLVGSPDVRRLTSDLGEDARPTWSPDGRQIAFIRQRLDDSTIHLVSPLGGAERRLGDFKGADSLAWSPDGKWLAAGNSGHLNFGYLSLLPRPGGKGLRGIYLVSVEGGTARPLIVSNPNRVDSKPAFSPDGQRLAYVSCDSSDVGLTGTGDCHVALVAVDVSRAAAQAPRRLTTQRSLYVYSLAWTRDGKSIIYDAPGQTSVSELWRVPVEGDHAPERIEEAGRPATAPALARSRDRLAFTRMSLDDDIYRFEAGGRVQLVAGSSFGDTDARLSADGRRLAFASARAGGEILDIWIAEADGSNPQQLTHGPGVGQGSPSWSPDGRRIAFDSRGGDSLHTHLWMIDADGGAPRRLTTQAGDQVVPMWSHDGRWIYYSWQQTDSRDIWRMPADGGAPERLTHGAGGVFACESADGKSLLFQPKDADSPLMTMELPSGHARQLVGCVKNSAFGVGPRGVYYVPCDPSPDPPVYLLDPKTGGNARLGTLDGLFQRPLGLSVSPDGETIVYPRQVLSRADLMLIENFR